MDPLDITHLRIGRFYGHAHAGLTADLGPGLTVVHGPNGQGKTTLARALRGVIWPETVRGYAPSYEAHFTIGGTPWQARFDGGRVRFQADGADADGPAVPDRSVASRYHLDLRDLVVDDGAAFADAVRRQAAGGVDVAQAAAALGARATVPRHLDASGTARQAADDLHALHQQMERLRDDEARLADLERDAEAAAAARAEADLYRLLDDRAAQHDALSAAEAASADFPDALRLVAPDTPERFALLAEQAAAARRAVATTEEAADEAARARADHGWADLALPAPDTLAARLRRTAEATRAVDVARQARDAAHARLAEARRPLGDAEAVAVTPEAVGEVARTVREASRLVARLDAARDAELVLRTRHQDIRYADDEAIRNGVRLLRRWLAYTVADESRGPGVSPSMVWTLAAVAAVVSGVAGFVWSLWALVGLVGGAGLAVVAFLMGRVAADPESPAAKARQVYSGLAADAVTAPAPSEWSPAVVENLVAQMDAEAARQTERKLWKERADEAGRQVHDAERAAADALAESRALADRLGVGHPDEPAAFFVHVEALARAAEAQRDAASADAALASAEQALAEALEAFRQETAGLPVPPAADADAAEGTAATVRDEASRRERLSDAVARADADAEAARAALRAADRALASFLAPFGLEAADAPAALAALGAARPRWVDACDRAREAAALAADADARTRAHGGFRETHLALDRPALARLAAESDHRAGRRDEHVREAERIRERVGQARRERRVADAAARHGAALDRLDETYSATADALVAHALAETVAEETRDAHLPRVFGRARDLFAEITRDRYRLAFRDGAFAAEDTARGWTLALDELSAGTRLHLLLAVRLAFVEGQEAGLRLPLVLDETLANSDDARAEAVAEALVALARGGRQIVYLTARTDEVAAWRRLAARHPDVPVGFVHLPGPTDAPPAEWLPAEGTTATVGAPADGETLDAYAARIGAPAWSGWDDPAALPVAALVDDAADLHALVARGYAQWGPLAGAVRRGVALPLSRDVRDRMATRALAAGAWAEAWREGRARRLDRAALAPMVTHTFLDAVADLADAHGGDAAAVLAALDAGAVARFGPSRTAALAAALLDGGFLATGEPLPDSAVRQRVAEAVPDALDDALVMLARVRTLGTPPPTASIDADGSPPPAS